MAQLIVRFAHPWRDPATNLAYVVGQYGDFDRTTAASLVDAGYAVDANSALTPLTVGDPLPQYVQDAELAALTGNYLNLAATPETIIAGSIVRDAYGTATYAPVIWPDGQPGLYRATVLSLAFPGAVDAYTISYGNPTFRTYHQRTVTRDSSGAVIIRPEIVVT